ncbi:MAG: hypothetical protein JJ964_15430 [Rhizobiales bacterium]|nr:hypothetical protein [Hyphomicrobiales bacterium]
MSSKRDSLVTTILMTILAAMFCAPFLYFEVIGQTIGHWIGIAAARFYCAFIPFWLRDKN